MKPSKTQRAEWVTNAHDQHGVVDDLCACDSLIDAIFAAGVEAAHDGMAVEWGWGWLPTSEYNPVRPCADEEMARRVARRRNARVVTRRVTEWQAADDA